MSGLFVTPRTAARQASLSFTISWSLLKFMSTDAIQPSHPLSTSSPPALNISQHQGLFQWVGSLHQVVKVLELQLQHRSFQLMFRMAFPGDSDGKESAYNAEDPGSIPGSGRSPGESCGYPLQYSCLDNSMPEEPGGLHTLHGVAESDMTEWLTHFSFLLGLNRTTGKTISLTI